MARVRVSFYIEADDPEHPAGVTEETFNEVENAVMALGGEDTEYDLDG